MSAGHAVSFKTMLASNLAMCRLSDLDVPQSDVVVHWKDHTTECATHRHRWPSPVSSGRVGARGQSTKHESVQADDKLVNCASIPSTRVSIDNVPTELAVVPSGVTVDPQRVRGGAVAQNIRPRNVVQWRVAITGGDRAQEEKQQDELAKGHLVAG